MRERDVALAFERAVQELVRLRPDVVIIAGDVFDRPDPPTTALVTLTRALETLREALPGTHVLLAAGVRDTPRRSGEPGVLAAVDTLPRVEAATGVARSVFVEELSLHALLLPHGSLLREPFPVAQPDPRARYHVVVAHGRITTGRCMAVDPREWDYVALGHEHSHRTVAPRVTYAGSLERVGPELWSEAAEEKGFVTVDLATGRQSFHPIPGRAVVALAPIRVTSDPDSMRRRVREVTEEVPGGIEDKIVRLRLHGIRWRDLVLLQGDLLSSLRARALHLVVEVEPHESPHPTVAGGVADRIREKLSETGADTPERLDRLRRLFREPRARGER